MKGCIIFISDLIIAFVILVVSIWGEYELLYKFLRPTMQDYSEWYTIICLIIMGGTFLGIIKLNGYLMNALFPDLGQVRNPHYQKKTFQNNNPSPIISKALGGYSREQLNEIFLMGILIHQIYMSDMSCNLSERQQRKSLSIQMRFFVTVFPQRDVAEYFDYSEQFINKNEHLASLSLDKCVAQSMQRLSDCNNKQIDKLRNLFRTLGTAYKEQVGGGNSKMITAFLNLLDVELSNLKTEEDWRDSYAKKKTH